MSEDTWTLAELSRITGLDYGTVKFYARPVDADTKGGGIIHEAKTVNGRRQFDSEALFDLYVSGLLKSTGARLEAIREANENCDYSSLLDRQLEEIKKKKVELERQENKLYAIRNLINAFENESDVMEQRLALAPIIRDRFLEYAQACFDEAGLKLEANKLVDSGDAATIDAMPHKPAVEEFNAMSSLFLSSKLDEASIVRLEELLNSAELKQFTDSFTGLLEMANVWHPGIKPTDPIFAGPIKEALISTEYYFGPTGRRWLPKACEYLFLTDLIGVALELSCGKGITTCLREAITYWTNQDE